MIIIIYLIKSFYSDQPLANLVGSQCWCIVPVSPGHGGDTCSGVNKNICPSNIVVFFSLQALFIYEKSKPFYKMAGSFSVYLRENGHKLPRKSTEFVQSMIYIQDLEYFLLVIEVISLKFTQMY